MNYYQMKQILSGMLIALVVLPATRAQDAPPAPPDVQPGDTPALPEGHPDIRELMRQQQQQAPSFTASLSVRAVQGTPEAPEVHSVPVSVDFYQQNTIVNTVQGELDQYGVVVFHEVPVTSGMRPVAKVEYAGVTYLEIGGPIDAANPVVTMDVTVYEITEEEPDWVVNERDLILHRQPDSVVVREVVTVTNPSDRTWFGLPDGSGKGDAFNVKLAKGTRDVKLGAGFHGWCCSKFSNETLINQMPMMPGISKYQFEYTVPIADGNAAIQVQSPVKTSRLMVYVPDDGVKIETIGMSEGEPQDFGQVKIRMFGAADVSAGQEALVRLVGLTTPGDLAQTTEATGQVKVIAGIGIGIVAVFGMALILFLPKKKMPSTEEA